MGLDRRAYFRAWLAAHREELREYGRRYRERPEVRERRRELEALKGRGHRAAYLRGYAKQPHALELARARRERWNAAHPELAKAHSSSRGAHRRALLYRALGSHTAQQWIDKCALLGNVCIYCGEPKPLTRDHKIPLSRGGSDDIANVVPACETCNKRKAARTAHEFLAAA